jgi:hypothetical protein
LRRPLLSLLARLRRGPGPVTRFFIWAVVINAVGLLAAYLGWTFIGHNDWAAGVPWLAGIMAGSMLRAWRDVHPSRPGWRWSRRARLVSQRDADRFVKSLYHDQDD